MLTVRRRVRARGDHVATGLTFATAAVVAFVAVSIGNQQNAAALLGGCVGALLAWQYATPPRDPWPVTVRTVVPAALRVGVLAAVALVLVVVDAVLVWFAVGLVGGSIVVGLPRLISGTGTASLRADVPG